MAQRVCCVFFSCLKSTDVSHLAEYMKIKHDKTPVLTYPDQTNPPLQNHQKRTLLPYNPGPARCDAFSFFPDPSGPSFRVSETASAEVRLNRLKFRQWYRPVAPMIADEALVEVFGRRVLSPSMEFAPKVLKEGRGLVL